MQHTSPACGCRIFTEGTNEASHFVIVIVPGLGLGLCPSSLGLTIHSNASEIFVCLQDCFTGRDCQLVYIPAPPDSPRVALVMAQAAQSVSVPANATCQLGVRFLVKSRPKLFSPFDYFIRIPKALFLFGYAFITRVKSVYTR